MKAVIQNEMTDAMKHKTNSMKQLKTLVLMQLRDKLDLSFVKDRKQLLRVIIFGILKFAIVAAISYIVLSLSLTIGLFYNSEFPSVMVLILTISLGLSLISCTFELTNNLYFSEDNRVLITLPVDTNKIFVSKIIVFYLYELKKSLNFLMPLTLSCVLLLVTKGFCSLWMFLWIFIPLVFILMLPVLIGSLLSILVMYIKRFLKKVPVLQVLLFISILILAIIGIVYLIGLIPENIDLIAQWPTVSRNIREFLLMIESKLSIMSQMVSIIIGNFTHKQVYALNLMTFVKLGILIGICFVLVILVYFISRPIFFGMMSKNFEIKKRIGDDKPNKKHNKYLTFIDKEFKINLRTINISVNYLMVYIIVPILILFLNAMYKAMDTRQLGDLLIYTFNILLICLPLLASNALVATYYSREGRAGYMKKTKPIYAAYPLFTKLVFNVIFSIPTVFVTCAIFGSSVSFSIGEIVILGFAILFLHLGHMIYSANLDIMNPQNEQYATTGGIIDNPNENKSTILAFILSAAYAIIAYKLLSEAGLGSEVGSVMLGLLKLMVISIAFFGSTLLMFIKRIKAFYYEIQG